MVWANKQNYLKNTIQFCNCTCNWQCCKFNQDFFRNGGSITLLNQGQTDSLPALPVNPSDAFAIFKPNYNPPLFHKAKEQILQRYYGKVEHLDEMSLKKETSLYKCFKKKVRSSICFQSWIIKLQLGTSLGQVKGCLGNISTLWQ